MKTYRNAAIRRDGSGKEVVPAGCQVLEALANADGILRFGFGHIDWGAKPDRVYSRSESGATSSLHV